MRLIIKPSLWALAAIQTITSATQIPILDTTTQDGRSTYNIAIIGAGAAGSSAAYHLSQFARELNLTAPINITIFESSDRIGGRTTTTNALNDPRYPVEVGGSIFVRINEILYNATREFGLSTQSRDSGSTGSAYDLGVWDGESFVFTLSNDDETSRLKGTLGNCWDIVKLFWRYGLSPIRLRTLQQSVIGRFLRLYHEKFPFTDLTQAAKEIDLLSITTKSGTELLNEAGVGAKFANEIIQASTRVNYAQNLPDFHGLETMVCMSTDGGMSVDGGNWQIFDRMVRESGAHLNLNSTVTGVLTSSSSDNSKSQTIIHYTTNESQSQTSIFDAVILAAPYNATSLRLTPRPSNPPAPPDYVSLHVTLFSSPYRPDPTYFNLDSNSPSLLPDTILTTLPPSIDPSFLGRGALGVGPTRFWSFSTLRTINPTLDFHLPDYLTQGSIPAENLDLSTFLACDANSTHAHAHASDARRAPNGMQYIYKIFSPSPLPSDFLIDLFGWTGHPTLSSSASVSSLPRSLVSWSHERTWNSYPYLAPTDSFDCFDLYDCPLSDDSAPRSSGTTGPSETEIKGKVYYTSAIERFISTMETSALSGRNVARLIVDGLKLGDVDWE